MHVCIHDSFAYEYCVRRVGWVDEEGEDEENTFCGSNGSTMDIIQLYITIVHVVYSITHTCM